MYVTCLQRKYLTLFWLFPSKWEKSKPKSPFIHSSNDFEFASLGPRGPLMTWWFWCLGPLEEALGEACWQGQSESERWFLATKNPLSSANPLTNVELERQEPTIKIGRGARGKFASADFASQHPTNSPWSHVFFQVLQGTSRIGDLCWNYLQWQQHIIAATLVILCWAILARRHFGHRYVFFCLPQVFTSSRQILLLECSLLLFGAVFTQKKSSTMTLRFDKFELHVFFS